MSTTTTLQATQGASDRSKTFIRMMVERSGRTESEIIESCVKSYGSVEQALRLLELGEAQNKAALERALPGGWKDAELQIGRKPRRGEGTLVSEVRDGLMIRFWAGDMKRHRYYCFDFLDRNGKYIRTPSDVKIHSMPTGFLPSMEVCSIERSLENSSFQLEQRLNNPTEYARTYDPDWETYLVPEGTLLRITQACKHPVLVQVPVHTPCETMLVPEVIIA